MDFKLGVFICFYIQSVTFFFPKFVCLYLLFLLELLLEVFKDLMPNTDYSFCNKHLHAKFKKNGPIGKTLKELMWNAKRAYKKNKHQYYTNKIKSISNKVHAFLS